MTYWLVSIIGLRILYCRLDPSLTKLLPNSLYPQVAPAAISNFTSAATGWQVVSNTSYYKHTRWLRADMAYKHCGAVSEGFCCLLYHQLWWLASTLCQQWRQWPCVCVCVLKLSAGLRPSQYLFKTPELCFSLTLPVYIGFTPHTHTLHHYEGMQAVWLLWADRVAFHFDEWLYYDLDNICMYVFLLICSEAFFQAIRW